MPYTTNLLRVLLGDAQLRAALVPDHMRRRFSVHDAHQLGLVTDASVNERSLHLDFGRICARKMWTWWMWCKLQKIPCKFLLTQHIDGDVPLVRLANPIVCGALVMADRVPVGVHHLQHIVGDVRLAVGHYVVLCA